MLTGDAGGILCTHHRWVASKQARLVGFFLFYWDGVRLSPLGTSATNLPIVPAPDDRQKGKVVLVLN
jgi:hypothetical protein